MSEREILIWSGITAAVLSAMVTLFMIGGIVAALTGALAFDHFVLKRIEARRAAIPVRHDRRDG